MKDYGQHTRPFVITPCKDCRMYPYIWTADCAKCQNNCNPYMCQNYMVGRPVKFNYDLAGRLCSDLDMKTYQQRTL